MKQIENKENSHVKSMSSIEKKTLSFMTFILGGKNGKRGGGGGRRRLESKYEKPLTNKIENCPSMNMIKLMTFESFIKGTQIEEEKRKASGL